MPDSSSWTELAAFWGAFTGSIAVVIQGAHFFKDRAKIVLEPRMSVASSMSPDPIESAPLVDFEVEVVNKGRRVAIIEEVGISFKGKRTGLRPRRATKLVVFSVESEGKFVQLLEGHKKKFELRRWQGTENDLAEAMAPSEKAYVKLTSGQVIKKKFKTASLSKYHDMVRQHCEKV